MKQYVSPGILGVPVVWERELWINYARCYGRVLSPLISLVHVRLLLDVTARFVRVVVS